jgi:hypothetical protein
MLWSVSSWVWLRGSLCECGTRTWVVATGDATTRLDDGQLVTVDGGAGTIHPQLIKPHVRVAQPTALDHPNVVRVFDFLDGEAPFLALELLEGQTLAERLRNGGACLRRRRPRSRPPWRTGWTPPTGSGSSC